MRTRSPYTLATMIFLASFFLRWELISKGPFHGDCMSLVMQAQQTAATGTVHYLHSHGFPLAAILNGFFVWTFQSLGLSDPVFAVNMMSVVFSSLTVLVFFLLTRIWFNENTAFFAAALFSATPIFLANSVYGNTHMPALFFALLGIYGIWKGYLPKQTHRSLILPAIFLGFGIAARAQDAFFFLPVVAALLCVHPSVKDSRFRKKLGAIVLFTGTAMLTAGLFYAPLIQQDFLIKSQRGHNLIHFLDSELLAHIATDFWIFLPLCFKFISSTITPAGVLLCISGLFFLIKEKRRDDAIILLIWFSLPFYFFSSLNFHLPRFFIICLLPLCIAMAVSCDRLLRYKRWIKATVLCFWALFLMTVPLVQILPVLQSRHDHAYTPDFVRWVKKTIGPDAQLIISDGSDFFKYYGPIQIIGRPLYISHYPEEEMAEFQKTLDQAIAEGGTVYITSNGLYSYDPEKSFSSFIKSRYCLKLIGRHPIELWHQGAIEQRVPLSGLYRVGPKSPLCTD